VELVVSETMALLVELVEQEITVLLEIQAAQEIMGQ
jgi:hypothetical protein